MSICSSFFCLLLQMNFLSSFMVFWAPGGWFDSANGGCWQKLEIGQRVRRVSLVLAHFLQSHRNWFVPLTLALPVDFFRCLFFPGSMTSTIHPTRPLLMRDLSLVSFLTLLTPLYSPFNILSNYQALMSHLKAAITLP